MHLLSIHAVRPSILGNFRPIAFQSFLRAHKKQESLFPAASVLCYGWLGTIHVLRNQDLGFSDPPPFPFVITFSTERNQKLPFSDPPSPLCDYVIHG